MFVVKALLMDWTKVLAGFSEEQRIVQLELRMRDEQGCKGYGVLQFNPCHKNFLQENFWLL